MAVGVDSQFKRELERLKCWTDSDRVPRDPEMTAFRRRARLHQAKWRELKGRPMGQYLPPKATTPQALGSRLPLDQAKDEGWNFLSEHIFEAAAERARNRVRYETLDRDRLWSDLLSSMPMSFNLFGEFWQQPKQATEALSSWLPGFRGQVRESCFEWSPGRQDREFLFDSTALDVAFLIEVGEGRSGIVGVETKYHEWAKPEAIAENGDKLLRYVEVAENSGVFKRDWPRKVLGSPLQQVWRDHLLVLSMLGHPAGNWTWGRYVLVYPRRNASFEKAAHEYAKVLANPETFVALTIEDLLDAGVLPATLQGEFRDRYLW